MVAFSIGMTGGIGCGKTTVADLFAARGASIIDTDVIAHQLTAPDGAAIPRIRDTFGMEFIDANGAMDRAKMRAHVFGHPRARQQLEAILHPMIREATEAAASCAEENYTIFVVPLLIESGTWQQRVDRILVVDCPEEIQVRRVMQRSGLKEAQVRAIMAAQISRSARLAAADDVIVNDGDIGALIPQIDALHSTYCALVKRK